jgi:hypothetical protein
MYRVENSNFIEPQHEKPFIDAITVIYDSPKNINIDIHYSSTLIRIYPHSHKRFFCSFFTTLVRNARKHRN